MRPRKCEISNVDGELFPASFHGFFSDGRGGVCAIIERENGSVEKCDVEDVHFLEQEHPRVEVEELGKGNWHGEFHGWYQAGGTGEDYSGNYPVALVKKDDGTFSEVYSHRIKFLKGGTNE